MFRYFAMHNERARLMKDLEAGKIDQPTFQGLMAKARENLITNPTTNLAELEARLQQTNEGSKGKNKEF